MADRPTRFHLPRRAGSATHDFAWRVGVGVAVGILILVATAAGA